MISLPSGKSDLKLIELAKLYEGKIITNDFQT